MNSQFPQVDPGDQVEVIEMSDELKERMQRNARDLADWLIAHTAKPSEAVILLDFVRSAIARQIGVKRTAILDASKVGGHEA